MLQTSQNLIQVCKLKFELFFSKDFTATLKVSLRWCCSLCRFWLKADEHASHQLWKPIFFYNMTKKKKIKQLHFSLLFYLHLVIFSAHQSRFIFAVSTAQIFFGTMVLSSCVFNLPCWLSLTASIATCPLLYVLFYLVLPLWAGL